MIDKLMSEFCFNENKNSPFYREAVYNSGTAKNHLPFDPFNCRNGIFTIKLFIPPAK